MSSRSDVAVQIMNDNQSHLVLFLPFLRLATAHTVAGIQFVPLRVPEGDPHPSLTDGADAITTILSSYKDRQGKPLDNCVVATVPGRRWDLSEADFSTVRWASSLLFLASWACNQYLQKFGGNYVNSTSFRLVGQKFSGAKPGWIGLHSRRRDGGKWDGGYEHGDALFSLPLQCSPHEISAIDAELLAGLDKAHSAGSKTIDRLRSALPFVSLANTDDDLMDESAEAILMASAFEQLMGSGQYAYRLGKLFGALFARCGTVTVAEARKARPGIAIDNSDPARAAAQPGWWVHRKWIEELHQLRSQAVHEGHAKTADDWGWNAYEHLLMAAHAFPLTVKALLERDGHYILSDTDKVRSRAMDKLLAITGWDQDTDNGPRWHQVISEVQKKQHWETVWTEVRKKYPDLLGADSTDD
jgi:hypothetical protein